MLTRRVGESIDIGNDITVKVIAVYGTQIRLGIEAPKEIPVARTELNEEKVKTGVKSHPSIPRPRAPRRI